MVHLWASRAAQCSLGSRGPASEAKAFNLSSRCAYLSRARIDVGLVGKKGAGLCGAQVARPRWGRPWPGRGAAAP